MVRATFDALKHQDFAAFGGGTPQHQGVHAASRAASAAMPKWWRNNRHARTALSEL